MNYYISKKWVKYKTSHVKSQSQIIDFLTDDERAEVDKMAYEEVSGSTDEVWDIQNQASIEGTLVRKETGQYGTNYVLDVNGKETLVWANTVLETKMARVKEGDKIKIEYLGEVKSKSGRMYRDFKLFIDKA